MLLRKEVWGINQEANKRIQGITEADTGTPKNNVLLILVRMELTPNMAKATGVKPLGSSTPPKPARAHRVSSRTKRRAEPR